MNRFEIGEFKKLLGQYFQLKERPYRSNEWFTSGKNAEECKRILSLLMGQIKSLISEQHLCEDSKFKVTYSKGSGYFPRVPWIAILFEGEKPTKGVYPVISFNSDNWHVACTESFGVPQGDFAERYISSRTLSEFDKQELTRIGADQESCHMALMPTIFSKDEDFTTEKLTAALKEAIRIHHDFRSMEKTTPSQDLGWKMDVRVDDVSKWMEAVVRLQSQVDEQWVFRGQSDEKWPLETSLGREVEYSSGTGRGIATHEQLKRAEYNAMTEFSREASRDIQYRCLKGVNLLSLMQHHGSKTRLLDFTYSPLSALFFAMERKKTASFAVWAVKLNAFCKEGANLNDCMEKDLKEADRLLGRNINAEATLGVCIVRPKVTNVRLSAQNGLFLMPKNLGVSFESNIRGMLPQNSPQSSLLKDLCGGQMPNVSIIKFVFPVKMKEKVFEILKAMQVTPRSIFPDVNGLAQSVTWDITDEFKK